MIFTNKIKELVRYYPHLGEIFISGAVNQIYNNRIEFEEYFNNTQKLQFVKRLKELTGGGLKECKDIADLYWEGKIFNTLREDRRLKLEQLAKTPLTNELVNKIENLNKDELYSFLMKFTIDELLTMDEYISEL